MERREFRRRDLRQAIRYAALCLQFDDKRHPHQYRIPLASLLEAERRLQKLASQLRNCDSFDSLYNLINSTVRTVHGIGELTVYDIAQRLGSHLDLEPDCVYLHAGTTVGAQQFLEPRGRRALYKRELPAEFKRLKPYEIEDCLCIYRHVLSQIMAAN